MTYDCIVLGIGGVGSATLLHLARRGLKVLGLDRFPVAHDRGSSHGDTRVIRLVYMEHPDYVPLVARSFELWRELEADVGEELYVETGLLQVGPANGTVIPGARRSAEAHNLAVEDVSPVEITKRFPGVRLREDQQGLYEQRAGYLHVERCVQAHVDAARRYGAEVVTGEAVESWTASDSDVSVRTDSRSYSAAKLVVTPGAWAGDLLKDLPVEFVVRRKPLLWYRTETPQHRLDHGMPTFFFEVDYGVFYGIPAVDHWGLKVAEHSGGEAVADPLIVDRELRASDRDPVERFVRDHLPGLSTELTKHVVCMYTVTLDEHFVLDLHPGLPNVAFVAGLSGHGFKFTPVLGEVLADLVTDGRAGLPIDFLSCRRFA